MTEYKSPFSPDVTWSDNCQIVVYCRSEGGLKNDTFCDIQFATDPIILNLLGKHITSRINTRFALLDLSYDTMYYFQFSVSLSQTVLITEIIQYTTRSSEFL